MQMASPSVTCPGPDPTAGRKAHPHDAEVRFLQPTPHRAPGPRRTTCCHDQTTHLLFRCVDLGLSGADNARSITSRIRGYST